jgi:hypothetical protein
MNYPEFYETIVRTAAEREQVLRAIGTVGISSQARIELKDGLYVVNAISEPAVAVISTGESSPPDRRYTTFVSARHPIGRVKYPIIETQPTRSTRLTQRDFVGELDQAIVDSLVTLERVGVEVFKDPISLAFIEGSLGSLMLNGKPTYPHEMSLVLSRIY